MPTEILVVDDDRSTRQWLSSVLQAEGYVCHSASSPQEAEEVLLREKVNLALVDIYLGDANGVDFIRRIKALSRQCDCVVMTAHASVETMAQAVEDGATEYLGKPLRIDDLLNLVKRLEDRRLKPLTADAPAKDSEPAGFAGTAIIGRSQKMLEVYRIIARVAPTNATVLLMGPSGSGKERVARAIHAHSKRADKPMTAINCGALAESVLESELFGHEKGAFTGADALRRGLFESTIGGTLFLDEISETTPAFQVKLLRVLQEKQVRRVGSNTYFPMDVRIVAATNADLGERIRAKQFREDLFYRLSVVTIQIPALEERREDIPLLVRHFLSRFNQRESREISISAEAVNLLGRMAWPGNVRELENLIERAAILCSTGQIGEDEIKRSSTSGLLFGSNGQPNSGVNEASTTLRSSERHQIVQALRDAAGNRSSAARTLGIERKTLYKKARRLGIDLDAPES